MTFHEQSPMGKIFIWGMCGGMVAFFLLCAGMYGGIVYYGIPSSLLAEITPELSDALPRSPASSLASDPVVAVADAASPAVVSLVVSKEVPQMEKFYKNILPFGFSVPSYRQVGTKEEEVAGGTGFFISPDGYLVTNNHVIDIEESSYTVYLNDGTSYPATLIAADEMLDVALLKVESPSALPFLEFGSSDEVRVGQAVVAIGNALGEYRNTVSSGVISGVSRTVVAQKGGGDEERLQDILQTDAAINPGNSGGPLLDLSGKVIGVNVAASAGGAENIGFALPSSAVSSAVNSLREHGYVVRPWLGVRYAMISEDMAKEEYLPVNHGALIRRSSENDLAVIPGSPADKAGLEENDIITKVNGKDLTEAYDLRLAMQGLHVGDVLELEVFHDDGVKTVHVTLSEGPKSL